MAPHRIAAQRCEGLSKAHGFDTALDEETGARGWQPFATCPVGMNIGEHKGMASQDLEQKGKLYGGFMSTLKWVIPLVAIIVFFVMMMIAG